MKDPQARSKRFEKHIPPHAFTDEDKQCVKDDVLTWNPLLEDGFPCSHSIQKRYFREEGTEWKKLHAIYAQRMEMQGHRVTSYDRWTQHVHFYHQVTWSS